MSNVLVELLKCSKYKGKAHAISRDDVAKLLGVSVRLVRAMAEESRMSGDPAGVVGYSSKRDSSGLYLCATVDEIAEVRDKVRRESLRRLEQLKMLDAAIAKVGQLALPLDTGRLKSSI